MAKITVEQFKNLSASEKRVRLAQDVVEHIISKKLIAQSELYISFGDEAKHIEVIYYNQNTELKSYLLKENTNCEVCAIGALYLSEVMYTNDVSMPSVKYPEGDVLHRRLQNYFEPEQLELIEATFEMDEYFSDSMLAANAISFGARFESHEYRMISIMENIIANNGEFIP